MSYWHFIKIIKGPGTSVQSPALSQEYVRNVPYMMMSQILKTQKTRYLENETFFLQNFLKKGWKFGVGAGLLKKEGGEVGVGD